MKINDNVLREVCGLITHRLIAQIKAALGCSDVEAVERFKLALTDLFPADDEPSSPPQKPKTQRKVRRHSAPLNRDNFPPELIKSHFYQIDGRVFRKVAAAGKPIGSEVGSKATLKRPSTINFDGYRFPRSHVVFVLVHGRWPRHAIFHKNFDRSDDRIENICEATSAELASSCSVSGRNRFGVKGVSWQHDRYKTGIERYEASIQRNGISRRLGTYLTAEEAHRAYCRAAADLHGNFNPSASLYNDHHEPMI